MPQKRAQPEARLQRAVVEQINWRKRRGWLHWATPNASKRSPRYGAELKRQGLQPGVGDISLLSPQGRYHELELKVARGRLSDHQKQRGEAVANSHGVWAVAFGLDDALRILGGWGVFR